MGNNPYLATLQNPFEVRGVRVPDMVTFPSSTFSVEYEKSVVIDSTNLFGAFVVYPFNSTTTLTNSNGPVSMMKAAVNTWSGSEEYFLWDQASQIASLYDSIRPVSAGLQIYSIGSSTIDGGEVCVGLDPRSVNPFSYNCGAYSDLCGQSFTKTLPFKTGGYVTWKPMDNFDMEYFPSIRNKIPGTTGSTFDTWPPCMIAAWASLAVGSVVKLKVIVNFEGIPSIDYQQFTSTTFSGHNQNWLDSAARWASGVANNMGNLFNTISPYVAPVAGAFAKRAISSYVGNRIALT